MGVTSINCSIYKVDIYNPKPVFEYPKGWYSYVGMTTRDDWHDRIEEHKIEPKPSNSKFEIIRERSNKPWKTELIKQWNMPFINSQDGLRFMSPAEQYYIKKYKTFGTIYGLNNSIGGDYGEGFSNTSGVKGVFWHKKSYFKNKGHWDYKSLCTNQDLRLLLYQLQDYFNIKLNILNKKKLKESLRISDEYKNTISKHRYYCGSPNIFINCVYTKNDYRWRIRTSEKKYSRSNTFDVIRDFGHKIYTPILFAYQAIGLENEWLIDQYTVDENKFMPFNEFEKKYTIKNNKKMEKVIKDNII